MTSVFRFGIFDIGYMSPTKKQNITKLGSYISLNMAPLVNSSMFNLKLSEN